MKTFFQALIVAFAFISGSAFADILNYGQLPTHGQEVQMTEEAEFEQDRWAR
ncbi:hypothetical protein [Marinobacterium jannaschii]|uniref:hypothetical protein n=1 Tax=Marinobacterium jannaschii TaxID=64970 RepID=UPI000A9CD5B8|nr:hypothetical protein [Marinobacterium jannaschii]